MLYLLQTTRVFGFPCLHCDRDCSPAGYAKRAASPTRPPLPSARLARRAVTRTLRAPLSAGRASAASKRASRPRSSAPSVPWASSPIRKDLSCAEGEVRFSIANCTQTSQSVRCSLVRPRLLPLAVDQSRCVLLVAAALPASLQPTAALCPAKPARWAELRAPRVSALAVGARQAGPRTARVPPLATTVRWYGTGSW